MEITKGFQISEPKLFIPWGVTEQELKSIFNREELRNVTDGYLTSSCISFSGLKHELGFHFNPRKNGRLGMLEFFRMKYKNLDKSFREFQQYFVGEFGVPHSTSKGTEGYPIHRWQFDHINIDHTIIDRFGPEEHMRISNLVYRMQPKLLFNKFFVFELNQNLEQIIPLTSIGTDESGWRTYFENSAGNWIKFFPYSEHHGGGQPFIILIGEHNHDEWATQNYNFENEIQEILRKTAHNNGEHP